MPIDSPRCRSPEVSAGPPVQPSQVPPRAASPTRGPARTVDGEAALQEDHMAPETVCVDVGGQVHRVPAAVLEKIPFFAPLLRAAVPASLEVDRDGTLFGEVVAFAAAGESFSGRPPSDAGALGDEGDFYCYDVLTDELSLWPLRRDAAASPSAATLLGLGLGLSAVAKGIGDRPREVGWTEEAEAARLRARRRLLMGLDVDVEPPATALHVQAWQLAQLEACWQAQSHANDVLQRRDGRLGAARELAAVFGTTPGVDALLAITGRWPRSSRVLLSIAEVARASQGVATAMLPVLRLGYGARLGAIDPAHDALLRATAEALLAAGCPVPSQASLSKTDPSGERALLIARISTRLAASPGCSLVRRTVLQTRALEALRRGRELAGQSHRMWADIAQLAAENLAISAHSADYLRFLALMRAATCPGATWRERRALVEAVTTALGVLSREIPPLLGEVVGRLVGEAAPGTWLQAELLATVARLLEVCGQFEDGARLARAAAAIERVQRATRASDEPPAFAFLEAEILFAAGCFAQAEAAARAAFVPGMREETVCLGFLSAVRAGDGAAVCFWRDLLSPGLGGRVVYLLDLRIQVDLDVAIMNGRIADVVAAAAAARLAPRGDGASLLAELKVAASFAQLPAEQVESRARASAAWARFEERGEHVDAQEALAMLTLARLCEEPARAAAAMARLDARRASLDPEGLRGDLVFLCLAEARESLAAGWTDTARALARMVASCRPQAVFAQSAAAAVLAQTGNAAEAHAISALVRQRREAAAGWSAVCAEPRAHTAEAAEARAGGAKRGREGDDDGATLGRPRSPSEDAGAQRCRARPRSADGPPARPL